MGQVICVDWDGCLHDRSNAPKGKKFGTPFPGAIDAVEAMVQEGITVIVYTVMAANDSGRQAVEDWLDYFDIPYSEVTAIKPQANLYIDDHGLYHRNWTTTIKEINQRLRIDI